MSQKPLCVVTHWVHPEIINYLEPHCRLVVNKTRETWPRQILFDHLKEADAAMMYGSFTQDGGNAYSTRQMREPDVPL